MVISDLRLTIYDWNNPEGVVLSLSKQMEGL